MNWPVRFMQQVATGGNPFRSKREREAMKIIDKSRVCGGGHDLTIERRGRRWSFIIDGPGTTGAYAEINQADAKKLVELLQPAVKAAEGKT